jgi:hypothetical protein
MVAADSAAVKASAAAAGCVAAAEAGSMAAVEAGSEGVAAEAFTVAVGSMAAVADPTAEGDIGNRGFK